MFIFSHALLGSFASKILTSILLAGLATSAAAHSYFFGISELTLNSKNKHLEIIHQFTAHDIENSIAEIKQIHFSPEHPKYEQYIQDYFEKNFTLAQHQIPIKLNWLGIEIKRGQLFAYQESNSENYLAHLVVKNNILVDTYAKQINTVNYQGLTFASQLTLQGSLTFNNTQRVAKIQILKNKTSNSSNKQ